MAGVEGTRKRPAEARARVSLPTFREAKRQFERAYVEKCLDAASGNVSAAARLADKDRKDFYDLMKRCGVLEALLRIRRLAR